MGTKLNTNERGFSIIETTLVFVVIVLLATLAGLVADKQTANQSQQLKPNVIQLGTTPSTHAADPTTTGLELSALGIDMTVPNAINDLTYAAPSPVNGGYGISTKTITTQDANCIATASNPPLGYFFKGTGQYPASGGPGQLVKQFSTFYIAWGPPKAACSANASVVSLIAQDQQSLEGSFKTIEQIPSSN